MHLLEASKPPEGAVTIVGSIVAAGTRGTTGTEAGIGGVGEGREPMDSKPDSRRSFWRGARARAGAKAGARAEAAVGARLGEISPGRSQ